MHAFQATKVLKTLLPKSARRAIRRIIETGVRFRNRNKIGWYDVADFPFIADLEANWQEIQREVLNLETSHYERWPMKIYNGEWDVFGLFGLDKKLEENCELCPVTTRVLNKIPNLTAAGFSKLMPGTHITPHVGYTDTRLRCHLGLIIPEDCGIRVGDETRTWVEGKCMVFDDTVEHEAWNFGKTPRVVLLLDFEAPGKSFDRRPPRWADKVTH